MAAAVTVDTDQLDRGLRELVAGLASTAAARAQADATARDIARAVPVRSGRLRATVGTRPDGRGYAVTYGGGLPYANYIEHRSNAVADAVDGADAQFKGRCDSQARKVIAGL